MAFFAISVSNAMEALIIQEMIKQYVKMRVNKKFLFLQFFILHC